MASDRGEVELWNTKLREGLEFRKIYGQDREWRRWRGYMRSQWGRNKMANYLPLNIVYAIGKALIPQVIPRIPQARVVATKPWFEPQARVLNALDSWFLRKLDLKRTTRRAAFLAYLYGTGFFKFGFDRQYGFPSEAQQATRGNIIGDFANRISTQGKLLEFNKQVFPGMPWVLPEHPSNVVLPWGCSRLDDTPWVAFRFVRSLESVRTDPILKRQSKDLKPTWYTGAPVGWKESDKIKGAFDPIYESPTVSAKRPESEQFVEMYEIHELEKGKIMVMAFDHGNWLRKDTDALLLDGLPVDALIFNDDDEVVWGNSDVKYLEPQQQEMNDILSQWQKIRRTSVTKLMYDKERLDPDEIEKLMNEDVRAAVGVDGNPREAVMELNKYEGQGLLTAARFVWENVREMVGFSRNQLGEFDTSSRRTATEANAVREAHMMRMTDRRDAAADLLIRTLHKLNQMVFNLWTEPQVIQVVGKDGYPHWVQFTGADLVGEFNYRIDLEEQLPQSKEVRKQEAILALQAFRGDPEVDQLALKKAVIDAAESLHSDVLLAPGYALRNAQGAPGQGQIVPFGQFAQQTMQSSPRLGAQQALAGLLKGGGGQGRGT